jgi:hypothetical protein
MSERTRLLLFCVNFAAAMIGCFLLRALSPTRPVDFAIAVVMLGVPAFNLLVLYWQPFFRAFVARLTRRPPA